MELGQEEKEQVVLDHIDQPAHDTLSNGRKKEPRKSILRTKGEEQEKRQKRKSVHFEKTPEVIHVSSYKKFNCEPKNFFLCTIF